MADYATVTGADLARVFSADGWKPQSTDLLPFNVVLWKDAGNNRPVLITLYLPVGKSKVERLCRKAGISATRFEDLYRTAPTPDWLPTASASTESTH